MDKGMKLHDYTPLWTDTQEFHHALNISFIEAVNNAHVIKEHRDFVEGRAFGFGQRSFWWLWKLICEELNDTPKMLEIGLFKGATVSLWRLFKPNAEIYAISPMNGEGLEWKDDNYHEHITTIHSHFNQKNPNIIEGLSEDINVILETSVTAPYDVLYIDGGHERRHIDNDLWEYCPMVKSGGYLVIDDCCNDFHMEFGYFQGIQDVTDGVVDYMNKNGDEWEFVLSVVHIKVYRKK